MFHLPGPKPMGFLASIFQSWMILRNPHGLAPMNSMNWIFESFSARGCTLMRGAFQSQGEPPQKCGVFLEPSSNIKRGSCDHVDHLIFAEIVGKNLNQLLKRSFPNLNGHKLRGLSHQTRLLHPLYPQGITVKNGRFQPRIHVRSTWAMPLLYCHCAALRVTARPPLQGALAPSDTGRTHLRMVDKR